MKDIMSKKLFSVFVFNIFLYIRLIRFIPFSVPYYAIEWVVLTCGVIGVIDFFRNFRWRMGYYIVFFMLILTGIGLAGNYHNGSEIYYLAILRDIYVSWRYVIILLFGMICGREFSKKNSETEFISMTGALLLSARLGAFVYAGAGVLSILQHKGQYIMVYCLGEMVMIMCTLLLSEHWWDIFSMAAISAGVLSARNSTALAITGVFGIIILYKWTLHIRSNILLLIGSAAGAVALGYHDFVSYYLNTDVISPRLQFVLDGVQLSRQAFPVGQGFASFCSQAALQYESPLYTKLQYDETLIGCSLDSFIGCVLGQFGFIGVALILLIFFVFFLMCEKQRKNVHAYAAMFLCFSFFLISALGGDSLFTASSVAIFIFGYAYEWEGVQNGIKKAR